MTTTNPRRVPHTGPGHATGDPGWCEGCAAEPAADRAEMEARATHPTDPRARLAEIDLRSHLAAIKARAEAATPGPWFEPYPESRIIETIDGQIVVDSFNDGVGAGVLERRDAEFIINARTDNPAMAAALEAVLGIEARDPAELVEPDAWTVGHVEGFNTALACMEAAITSALGGDRG